MDQFIQHWINRENTSPFLDHIMAGVTNYSAWFPILVAAVIFTFVFGSFHMRAMLVCLALAFGFTDGVLVNGIKHAVGRARPLQVEPGVRVVHLQQASPQILTILRSPKIDFPKTPPLGTKVIGRSFPSSHAANIMVSATVLFLFYRRFGVLYFLIAALVCYSRVYTGAHWPLDVLVGAFIGMMDAILITRLVEHLWKKWGPRFAPILSSRHPSLLLASFDNK